MLKGSGVPTEVGLLVEHRSNFSQTPFLLPPMTHIGTSGSWTQAGWVQLRRLNQWAMADPVTYTF